MSCRKFSHSPVDEVARSLCMSTRWNVNSNNNTVAELPGQLIGTAADGDFNTRMPRVASLLVHIQYESPSYLLPTGFCAYVCSDCVKVQ